jgi:hypothetical protein
MGFDEWPDKGSGKKKKKKKSGKKNIEKKVFSKIESSDESQFGEVVRPCPPTSIVFTGIPLLTWLLPFIGHIGIVSQKGISYDFAGPYFVSIGNLAFGRPVKFAPLDPKKVASGLSYEGAVESAHHAFRRRMYNFCCMNCHSFVAHAMNEMRYDGREDWNMVRVWWYLTTRSTYVSWLALFRTYLPAIIIYGAIIALSLTTTTTKAKKN